MCVRDECVVSMCLSACLGKVQLLRKYGEGKNVLSLSACLFSAFEIFGALLQRHVFVQRV